jgi:leucyl aminopeptidase
MISFSTQSTPIAKIKADAVAMFIPQDRKMLKAALAGIIRLSPDVETSVASSAFAGKLKETLVLFPVKTPFRRLVLAGVGAPEALDSEKLRRAVTASVKAIAELKSQSLALLGPEGTGLSVEQTANALAEGILLSTYRFDKYLTVDRKPRTLKSVSYICTRKSDLADARRGLLLAEVSCAGTILARDLANAPANEIYPDSLAARARRVARGFSVKVLDEKKIESLGMGGLTGVSRGSNRPPRFIIMEYRPRRGDVPTVVLVGKGVTFDSGGISIKPAAGMSEMKMDMSGAAAVIGTMTAVARLGLPVHLVGLVPATENMLGGSAMKPGDIITHMNGKTSEVDNTDAEGRLILADALTYADRYKPDLVIDLATLTGACVVALGSVASGMMGNTQKRMDQLKQAGERTHERVWQLPLFEEYEQQIKSDVADVKNVGGRWAGAITAGLFLRKFIGKYDWIHIDIAGPAILEEEREYIPKGGSGVGVRLLVDFLRHWKGH